MTTSTLPLSVFYRSIVDFYSILFLYLYHALQIVEIFKNKLNINTGPRFVLLSMRCWWWGSRDVYGEYRYKVVHVVMYKQCNYNEHAAEDANCRR